MGANATLLQTREVEFGDALLPVSLLQGPISTDVGIAVARLAEALDIDRQAIHQLVDRDPVLQEYAVNVTLTTGATTRPTAFLLRPGVLGVLLKLSTRRIKDSATAKRIRAFQRWAFETLDRTIFSPEPRTQPVPARGHTYPIERRCKVCMSPLRSQIDAMLLREAVKPDGTPYKLEEIAQWARGHDTQTSQAALSRHYTKHLAPAAVTPISNLQNILRELSTRDLSRLPTPELASLARINARLLELGV